MISSNEEIESVYSLGHTERINKVRTLTHLDITSFNLAAGLSSISLKERELFR